MAMNLMRILNLDGIGSVVPLDERWLFCLVVAGRTRVVTVDGGGNGLFLTSLCDYWCLIDYGEGIRVLEITIVVMVVMMMIMLLKFVFLILFVVVVMAMMLALFHS